MFLGAMFNWCKKISHLLDILDVPYAISSTCFNCSLPGQYIESNPLLPQFLHKLKAKHKKLFLITNSPYWFV